MQKWKVIIDDKCYIFSKIGKLAGNETEAFIINFNSNVVEITSNNKENNKNKQDTTINKDSSNSSINSNSGENNKPIDNVPTESSIDCLENYREHYHYSSAKGWEVIQMKWYILWIIGYVLLTLSL